MLTLLEITLRSFKSYAEDHCSLLAASITYFSLVSLFPLAIFAIGVAGFIFQSDAEQQRIVDEITRALPVGEGGATDQLRSLIGDAVAARGALGLVGLIGTAYVGSALFGAVRAALVAVYEKEKRRPFLKAKLLDVALVLGFTTLLMLSVTLTFLIALAQHFSTEIFGPRSATLITWLLTLAYPTAPAAISFLVFFLLYTVVADAGLRRADAAWGALVATLGFEGLKVGFAQYVAYFGNYEATYGTIGFLVALLAFFYFGAQSMLLGAEVAESRMLVVLAEPPERFREVQALGARIRRLVGRIPGVSGVEPRPAAVIEESTAIFEVRATVGGAEESSAPAMPSSSGDAPPGDRGSGWGAFLLGLVLGALAAVALRRRDGRRG